MTMIADTALNFNLVALDYLDDGGYVLEIGATGLVEIIL